ncbi:MAG: EamA family transporter [Desulfobacterales bacterium]|nr:EamA family transporter [Desulfobacterales bacterium]
MSSTATILALITIALWSFLAYLGAGLNNVPPFLLVGIALCISGIVGSVRFRLWRVPLKTLAMGVGGIFGYNFLYFFALQNAPAVEASLINYLWPLLIVILSPVILNGYTLKPYHLIGAVCGLAGAGLIVTGGRLNLDMANMAGYLFAAGAALTWACYSLLTKKAPPFSSAAVGAFCLISGILSLGMHFLIETSFTPAGRDWLFLILLGTGPLGAAFFTWDAAMKKGDPRIIGSLSYLTPMTSTLVLVVLGGHEFKWSTAAAMVLIVFGALVGSLDMIRPKHQQKDEVISTKDFSKLTGTANA